MAPPSLPGAPIGMVPGQMGGLFGPKAGMESGPSPGMGSGMGGLASLSDNKPNDLPPMNRPSQGGLPPLNQQQQNPSNFFAPSLGGDMYKKQPAAPMNFSP